MKNIKVFTTKTWPHCVTVKEYLSQKGIDFEEVDVTSNGEARKELMKKRIMAVPVVKINEEYIVGYDKEKLDKMIWNIIILRKMYD